MKNKLKDFVYIYLLQIFFISKLIHGVLFVYCVCFVLFQVYVHVDKVRKKKQVKKRTICFMESFG